MDGDSGQDGKCRSQGKLAIKKMPTEGMPTEDEDSGAVISILSYGKQDQRLSSAVRAWCEEGEEEKRTNPNPQPNGFYDLPRVIVGATGPPGVSDERIRKFRSSRAPLRKQTDTHTITSREEVSAEVVLDRHARNPTSWLDKVANMDPGQLESRLSHARLIRALAQYNSEPGNPSASTASEAAGEVVQGGPKTQEAPMEDIPEQRLLDEIDFSPELDQSNKKALQIC
ncbi:hypothetical protein JB92DRAFT_3125506 [Gautieria morchelliformis]|nr:hypothetical protein JB92DRAFT_3125506 [Gautieria morchelliformis]